MSIRHENISIVSSLFEPLFFCFEPPGEHGFCNLIRNKRLVRIVERPIWEQIKILFPNAISHPLNCNIIERGCDFCNDEKKRRVELPKLMLDWADSSFMVSKILDKEISKDIINSCHNKTFYLVHRADLHSWRMFIDFVRKVCPPKKGREAIVANQLENEVSNVFFLQRAPTDNDSAAVKGTSHVDIKWRIRKLTCQSHNRTLASIGIIHRAISSELSTEKGFLVNDIHALAEEEYTEFISSIVDLQSLVCEHIREVSLSIQDFHPQIKLNQNCISSSANKYSGILQMNAIKPRVPLCHTVSDCYNRGDVVFDPLICKDVSCLSNFSRYLDDIQTIEDETSSTESSKKKSRNRKQAVSKTNELEPQTTCGSSRMLCEDVDETSFIQVNVHEFDTSCELRKSIDDVEKEFKERYTTIYREDRSTVRRSSRKRNGYQCGKNMFSLSVSKDANLATLRLQIYEQSINKDLANHALSVFVFDSTKGEGLNFELKGEWNERIFYEILKNPPLRIESNDSIIIILNTKSSLGSSNRKKRRGPGCYDYEETALFDVLVEMSNVAQSINEDFSRPDKRTRQEKGFVGTFLQSTAEAVVMQTSMISSSLTIDRLDRHLELDDGGFHDVLKQGEEGVKEKEEGAPSCCSASLEQKEVEITSNEHEVILIDDD